MWIVISQVVEIVVVVVSSGEEERLNIHEYIWEKQNHSKLNGNNN